MKKAYVIVGILLALSTIGIFLIRWRIGVKEDAAIRAAATTRAIEAIEAIEGEEVMVTIALSYSPSRSPERLIKIYNSGKVEVVEKNTGRRFTKDILVGREDLVEFVRLADELTGAQRREGCDEWPVESWGPTYIKIMYQEKNSEHGRI